MRQAPRSPLSFKLQRVANVPEHPPPSTRLMSCAHIANRQLSRIIGASSVTRVIRLLNALEPGRIIRPKPIDPAATMPPQKPDRSAEAVRRVLSELRTLNRYERRAAARRDRAVLNLLRNYN